MRTRTIEKEERYIEREFGEEYLDYRVRLDLLVPDVVGVGLPSSEP